MLYDSTKALTERGFRQHQGRRVGLRYRVRSLMTPALSGAILLTSIAVAWGADDNTRVSITPRIPRRILSTDSGAIRLDVNLVLVPVMVTDTYERPVHRLKKSDFRLFEDGIEQDISQFFTEDSPISVGIVFDASASMRRKMDESRQAVVEFLRMSLPGDEFFLMKFSDHPEQVCGFTTEPKDIEDGLPTIQPGGWTSLYDAMYLGIHFMKRAKHGRRILLVLSDGGDNVSRYTEREIKELVKEADVRIFAISILDKSPSLEAISEESGGHAHRVRKIEDLPDLAAKISAELHSEYVLGYRPADRPYDGKYRKVKVEVLQQEGNPRLRSSWKRGYYSPIQ
jgi:Ca-activated chloride channel homolog